MGAGHHMMHGQHMMSPGQHMHARANDAGPATGGRGRDAAWTRRVRRDSRRSSKSSRPTPKTDWSKVNIDALRQHLVDMNSVTLAANVKNEPIDGGMRFDVTGEGPVRDFDPTHDDGPRGHNEWR